MAYATSTQALLDLASSQAEVDEALEAGAQDIDDAFAAAGYTVPLDTSVLATEGQVRLDAKLAVVNRALAAAYLSHASTAKRGASDKVKKDRDTSREWLDRIRARHIGYPGLPARFPLQVLGDAGTHSEIFDIANQLQET